MRVAFISYPTVFQSPGGIRMKMGRTITALQRAGIDARLMDTTRERFTDFDVVHVFAAFNCNHRIVLQARSDGVPVVLSTILNPPFTRWEGWRARLLDRAIGRLTNWEVTTSYRQILLALEGANRLVVLGSIEREIVAGSYGVDASKVVIIPNGIGEEFFSADPGLFTAAYQPTRPFVLHVGNVGDVKNQLGLVRALRGMDVDVVLVGHAGQAGASYLQTCLDEGGAQVRYLGEFEHGRMLASAYAAAAVFALPSRHEGMPNSVLEALACDRPVVMTRNHTMDMDLPSDVIQQVDADDAQGIRRAVEHFLKSGTAPGRARSVVDTLSWDGVARRLGEVYREVLAEGQHPLERPGDGSAKRHP